MNEGYKKAALRIYGLSASDQQWILGSLPEKQRGMLSELLSQLGEMRVPKNHLIFSDLIDEESTVPVETAAVKEDPPTSDSRMIDDADPVNVAEALLREPDWLIALALLSGEWRWMEYLINRLDAERRERVRMLTRQMAERLQPKLKNTVIDLLANRFLKKPERMISNEVLRLDTVFEKYQPVADAVLVDDVMEAAP